MRPGFYVHGRRYSFDKRSQAIARAEFLAGEFGRDVAVEAITPTGTRCLEHTARFAPQTAVSTNCLASG